MKKNMICYSTTGVMELLAKHLHKSESEMILDFLGIKKELVDKINIDYTLVKGKELLFGKDTFLTEQTFIAKEISFVNKLKNDLKYKVYVNDFGMFGFKTNYANINNDDLKVESICDENKGAKQWRAKMYNFDRNFVIKELNQMVEDYKNDTWERLLDRSKQEAQNEPVLNK